MLRWLTAGESHGQQLTAILEGLPAGVEVQTSDVDLQLARRRLGHGRGARMSFEQDEVTLTGGVRHGRTQGGPIAIQVGNTEWPKWSTVMSADPVDAEVLAGQARNAPLTRPRPGHADLAGMQKYGFDDARPVLERASARETAARVALGAIAQAFLRQVLDVEVVSHVVAIGPVTVPDGVLPGPLDNARIDEDPVRCADPATSERMVAEIDDVRKNGDTLGGVIEVVVHGLPPGLGSHVHWDRRLDSRLAGALMGVQSVKAVEVGDGLETARRRGSVAHDEIDLVAARDGQQRVQRRTDRAGGIEGGMTNGEVLLHGAPRARHRRHRHAGARRGHQPAQRRLRGAPRQRRHGGDGRPGAGRRRRGEVRRGLGSRDPPQRAVLPRLVARPVSGPLLALVGPPASGKTTVGTALARALGVALRDTDHDIEAEVGSSVADVFIQYGEAHFRALEVAAVARALAEHDGVLALGGGAVMADATRALLVEYGGTGGTVVWLDVDLPSAAKRAGFSRDRPLLAVNPRAMLRTMLEQRAPLYAEVATVKVSTAGRTVDEVAAEVLAAMPGRTVAP
jgi:chorismate synthase